MTSAEELRPNYPNLDPAVSIFRCTADDPMDPTIGPMVEQLKQLWIHEGLEDIVDTGERYVSLRCAFCGFSFDADLGD